MKIQLIFLKCQKSNRKSNWFFKKCQKSNWKSNWFKKIVKNPIENPIDISKKVKNPIEIQLNPKSAHCPSLMFSTTIDKHTVWTFLKCVEPSWMFFDLLECSLTFLKFLEPFWNHQWKTPSIANDLNGRRNQLITT